VIFYVSDTHIDHEPIIGWCPKTRGHYKSVDEMNEDIVKVWNETVGKKDEVRIIGDLAFKNHRKWVNALNGKKVIVLGNHDGMKLDALAGLAGELDADTQKTLQQFRRVATQIECTTFGQRMIMNHYPLMTWEDAYSGAWCLHGHVHGRIRESLPDGVHKRYLYLDVGWDVHGRPISFEEIDAIMLEKAKRMPEDFRVRYAAKLMKYRKDWEPPPGWI